MPNEYVTLLLSACKSWLASASQKSDEHPEFLNRQAGILGDTANSISIDRIGSWNCQNTGTVRHDDMLAIPDDPKACLLKGSYSIPMIYTWNLRHR